MSTQSPPAAQTSDTSRAADFWPVLLCWEHHLTVDTGRRRPNSKRAQ